MALPGLTRIVTEVIAPMPKALPPAAPADPRYTVFCYALLSIATPADAVIAFGVRLISDHIAKNATGLAR